MNNKKITVYLAVFIGMLCFTIPALAQEATPAKAAPHLGKSEASKGVLFNRLLRRPKYNLPPAEDGIHDPENEGTYLLQPPKEGLKGFPKASSGNRVDWVKALSSGVINPRADRLDPTEELDVFEFDVLREVRGSMPNVLFPHDKHTEWLVCENCHDDIFIPEVGANQISMALILAGQKCGVCHGKVSFPVTQCRKCHSQKKDAMVKKSKPKQ